MNHPIAIVNKVCEEALKYVEPPQLFVVFVSDPPGVGTGHVAFRHNAASEQDLSRALRELADKLDAGEARETLQVVK